VFVEEYFVEYNVLAGCIQIAYCVQFDFGTTGDRKIALYNDRLQIFLEKYCRSESSGGKYGEERKHYIRQTNVRISSILIIVS
jgi:hypothetical protein